eukprot:TRINITY_DN113554_c0_g1_i1.p1 TRINITY_DN113554_c0_g1~~TRINITY_DN113554_c0_g1_i1.p1  ORF type:complete len:280 (-),score=44.65 TRINITY_DN113554_c0_g1_i1:115-921(-)
MPSAAVAVGRHQDEDELEEIELAGTRSCRIDKAELEESEGENAGFEVSRPAAKAGHSHPCRLALALFLGLIASLWELGLSAEALHSGKAFGYHTSGMVFAVVFWCLGSAVGGLTRIHTLLQVMAAVAVVVGYAGIYVAHTSGGRLLHGAEEHNKGQIKHHRHHLALTHPWELLEKPLARILHVVLGYLLLACVAVQVCSGMLKVWSSVPKLKWHGHSGRAICFLGAINVAIGSGLLGLNMYNGILILLVFNVTLLSHSMRWVKSTWDG